MNTKNNKSPRFVAVVHTVFGERCLLYLLVLTDKYPFTVIVGS